MINILRKHGSMIEAGHRRICGDVGSDPNDRCRYDPIGGHECQQRVFVGCEFGSVDLLYVFTHEGGPSTCAGIAKPNK